MNKKLKHYFANFFWMAPLGAVLVAAGVLIYWYSMEIWAVGTPMIAVGIALLILWMTLRVTDEAYSAYFAGKVREALGERADEADFVSDAHSFDGNKFAKLDSQQKPRSEKLTHAELFFPRDKKDRTLSVDIVRVDAMTDEAVKESFSFPLDDVTAELSETKINCAGATKTGSVLTLSDGGKSCSFPVRANDVSVDEIVEKINDRRQRA